MLFSIQYLEENNHRQRMLYLIKGQQEPNLVNWIKQITDTLIRSKAETHIIGTRTKRAIFTFFYKSVTNPNGFQMSPYLSWLLLQTRLLSAFWGWGWLYLLNSFPSYCRLLMFFVLNYNVSTITSRVFLIWKAPKIQVYGAFMFFANH